MQKVTRIRKGYYIIENKLGLDFANLLLEAFIFLLCLPEYKSISY
jgi:hypothetical protein